MINHQSARKSFTLGVDSWADRVKSALREGRCVGCGEPLCLSDDEILTDFQVLDPREATVDDWVLWQIVEARSAVEQGEQLALVRWKDGVESLVAFRPGVVAPPAEVLTAAYWNGCSVDHLRDLLEQRWDTP